MKRLMLFPLSFALLAQVYNVRASEQNHRSKDNFGSLDKRRERQQQRTDMLAALQRNNRLDEQTERSPMKATQQLVFAKVLLPETENNGGKAMLTLNPCDDVTEVTIRYTIASNKIDWGKVRNITIEVSK